MRLAVRPTSAGPEYVLMNERYGIVYHIVGDAASGDTEAVVRTETDRLRGLEIELRDKLMHGTHMFVVKSNEDLCHLEADVVLQQLKRFGRNALLYVVRATAAHSEGSVLRVGADLYRGHIGRFAPYRDAYDTRTPAWLAICRNTLRLHRAALTRRLIRARPQSPQVFAAADLAARRLGQPAAPRTSSTRCGISSSTSKTFALIARAQGYAIGRVGERLGEDQHLLAGIGRIDADRPPRGPAPRPARSRRWPRCRGNRNCAR